MEVVSLLVQDRLEHEIRVFFILFHFGLHLLPLTVQPVELVLEVGIEGFHLGWQVDVVLGGYIPFWRQLEVDVLDWGSLLCFEAFEGLEEETFAVIVGDVVQDSLLNPDVGYLLEVDEQFIGLVEKPIFLSKLL